MKIQYEEHKHWYDNQIFIIWVWVNSFIDLDQAISLIFSYVFLSRYVFCLTL